MYENCLQRHNKFIREVHYVLKKQERKASINLEDTKLLQAFWFFYENGNFQNLSLFDKNNFLGLKFC